MSITVNGAPLSEYIDAEVGREIGEVRNADKAVKVRRPIVSKSLRNSSGARTARGEVIYRAGQRETHVIVTGEMFPWIDKHPFVPSGHSTLGALEYDEKTDEVKCHECGEWCKSIGSHVSREKQQSSHPTMREYRIRHGFRLKSPLSTPSVFTDRSEKSKGNTKGTFTRDRRPNATNGGSARAELIKARRELNIAPCAETANLISACKAQRLSTLKEYSKELGRIPTIAELKTFERNGRKPLWPTGLIKLFRVPMSKIFIQAGLQPRKKGIRFIGGQFRGGRMAMEMAANV